MTRHCFYSWLLKLLVFLSFLTPAMALAQGSALRSYVEGQFSRVLINDVDGTTNVLADGFNIALAGEFEYEEATSLGAEIGIKGIGGPNIRLGISYQRLDFELDAIDISAALSFDGNVLTTAAGRFTREEAEAAGLEFGNRAKAYSLNAYYDFDQVASFTPYVGMGIGLVDIENTEDKELMLSGYLGINYSLSDKFYAGFRGAARQINGPTDLAGIDYDDVVYYEVGAVIGVRF